jgi:hypothetical protein
VEDVECGFELVLDHCHDISVGIVWQNDSVALKCSLQCADVVAKPCCSFVLLMVSSILHLALQLFDESGGVTSQEGAEVVDEDAMVFSADSADAGGRTLVDVSEQAGPTHLPCSLEDAGAARPDREDPQQLIERLANRPGM